MFNRVSKSVMCFVVIVFVMSISLALGAQDKAKPAAPTSGNDSASRWDIFLGYSYLSPRATVYTPAGGSTVTASYDDVKLGSLFSGSYFFNRYIGVQAEFGIHEWGSEVANTNIGTHGNDDGFTTIAGGVIVHYPAKKFTPFVHVLSGGALVNGPYHNPNTWGPAVTIGGGVDYNTSLLKHHLAIRLVQVDYEHMKVDFGASEGGSVGINAPRLSAGIVFHSLIAPPTPLTMACSANPASVFPGETVTVTATSENLNPKEKAIYTWSGTGVTSNGETATVNTSKLAPGRYTVRGDLKEVKQNNNCPMCWETSDCSAIFVVKKFDPPTIDCTAAPGSVKPGETATVTATGVSPQGRPLTYSYSTSAGTVSGSGSTAVFNSVGAPTGPVSIPCVVTDDYNQTATSTANVTILPPYVPPVSHTKVLCSIAFDKDKKRPTRVNNEAKACLDEVALDLQKQPDATIVLVGSDDAKEKAKAARDQKAALRNKHLKVADNAAERAVNTKDYLVKEKGIDASRIVVATSSGGDQSVEDYLVPAGANFNTDVPRTTPVNEAAVKPVPRKPLAAKPAAHKKAVAPVKK